jgi:hypothetical protein
LPPPLLPPTPLPPPPAPPQAPHLEDEDAADQEANG